jgi:hypothetical protein
LHWQNHAYFAANKSRSALFPRPLAQNAPVMDRFLFGMDVIVIPHGADFAALRRTAQVPKFPPAGSLSAP